MKGLGASRTYVQVEVNSHNGQQPAPNPLWLSLCDDVVMNSLPVITTLRQTCYATDVRDVIKARV